MHDITRRIGLWEFLRYPIASLLWLANRHPPCLTSEFYAIKRMLLLQYGTYSGFDFQEICDECFACDGTGSVNCPEKKSFVCCWKCSGTGFYRMDYVFLEHWTIGPFVFFIPAGVTTTRPRFVTIRGRIRYQGSYLASREATFWLYLLSGRWTAFTRLMNSGFVYGVGMYPMLNLQRIVYFLKERANRSRHRREEKRLRDIYQKMQDELPF